MSLSAIASKPPVVSTVGVDALARSAERVRETYDWLAGTYVEQPAIGAWQASFLKMVLARKTPKASIVAPFGYGKSATAIGVWRACEAAGILAVPPVACGSFTEVAYAVCDWLVYRLPERAGEIASMRERFLVGSADLLARRDEREFAIPYDQALASIQDKLERGYLDFEDVSINLLALLESATALALGAGFGGLVIIVDEGQQLIGNAGKGVLVALRQLVWGLRTRELPLGLLITLDPDTERTLADRAGDILHRVKDDGLYLDIRDVYSREFPARLWQQYSAAFGLVEADRAAIDRPTLDALGQLCEREDLSNGPRTVVDVLQHAAARRAAGAPPGYSPVQLIDDLLCGEIRFTGDRNTLPALVSELLNYGYFQRNPERAAALKLVAVFPRGCPPDVARRYGLKSALAKLDSDLRGEVLTKLDEGLALIELQRVARPANRLNQLLRRYWMQITDEELFAEDATKIFAETVIPLLFPSKQHDLNGWSAVRSVQLAPDGTYRAVYEGTASLDFPLRRIGVCVLPASAPDPERSADLDFWFVFRISADRATAPEFAVDEAQGALAWTLSLLLPAAGGLDAGLRWIEHYLNPHPISPATVLSLLRYLERESSADGDVRDQARILDTLERLRGWLLSHIFAEAQFASAGYVVAQSGAGALAECLYTLSRARWTDYRPLATQRNWSSMLDDYVTALGELEVPVRAGEILFSASKSEAAALLGQERHAGFESRARQYGPLLDLVKWNGDQAELRFRPIAPELFIAGEVRRRDGWSEREAYATLRQQGYSAAEANQIIRLGAARGLFLARADAIEPPAIPRRAEILARIRALAPRLAVLAPTLSAEREEIESLERQEEYTTDPSWRLDQIERRIEAAEAAQRAAREEILRSERALLLDGAGALRLLSTPPKTGELRAHLAAVHVRLGAERTALAVSVREAAESDDIELIREQRASASLYARRADDYHRWSDFAARIQDVLRDQIPDATRDEAAALLAKARRILSVDGIAELGQIALLDLELAAIEEKQTIARGSHELAAQRCAASLGSELAALLDLPHIADLGPHQGTMESVHANAVQCLRRWLAATRVEAFGDGIVEDARDSVLREIDGLCDTLQAPGAQLFARSGDHLDPALVAQIRSVRDVVAACQSSPTAKRLSSALTCGPADLTTALAGLDTDTPLETWLGEFATLIRHGLIRVIIDVPASVSAAACDETPELTGLAAPSVRR